MILSWVDVVKSEIGSPGVGRPAPGNFPGIISTCGSGFDSSSVVLDMILSWVDVSIGSPGVGTAPGGRPAPGNFPGIMSTCG